jgi:hypothetical protein
MAGWICFILTFFLGCSVLMKIPIDTQFFTIVNSVLVAYVVTPRRKQPKADGSGDDEGSPTDAATAPPKNSSPAPQSPSTPSP